MQPLRFSWWALLAVGLLGGSLTLALCGFDLLPETENIFIDLNSGRLKVVERTAGIAHRARVAAGPDFESEYGYYSSLNRTAGLYFLYHGSYPANPEWALLETRTRWLDRSSQRRTAWRKMLYLPDGVGLICKGQLKQDSPPREVTAAAAARFVEDWLVVLRSTPDATIPQRFLLATAGHLLAADEPITPDDLLDPREFVRAELERGS